jgi:hypothetical protein
VTQIEAAQPVYETTASALREKSKLRRHFRRFDMLFYLICTVLTIDTIGAGGNPNDNLAALSFSHQRLQYELTQIVPLAIIVAVGVVFYFLGGKTRQEVAAEPVIAPAPATAGRAEQAP